MRLRGGDAQGPGSGLDGMNLIRDLGAAFLESHCELSDKSSSPFSSNRTMFETEEVSRHKMPAHTVQSRSQTKLVSAFVSQMVIPADPEEMKEFQEQCVAQCQCAVDITLPQAYIILPSKQAFQSIYNRYGYRATGVVHDVYETLLGLLLRE